MKKMQWDSNLAALAQEWADDCEYKQGNKENSVEEYIGQNILWNTDYTNISATAVKLWHDEVVDYNFESNSCNSKEVCGHYTQVMWADSYRLGCGKSSKCPDDGMFKFNNKIAD